MTNEKLRKLLKEYLEGYEFKVLTLADGEAVLNTNEERIAGAGYLDVMLSEKRRPGGAEGESRGIEGSCHHAHGQGRGSGSGRRT